MGLQDNVKDRLLTMRNPIDSHHLSTPYMVFSVTHTICEGPKLGA